MAKSRIFIKTATIPRDDVAIDSSSGWREKAPDRIAELKEAIYRGEFGQTILGKPSVLCDEADQAACAQH